MPTPTHQNSRADYLGTHNQMLPNNNTANVGVSNAVYEQSLGHQAPQAPQASQANEAPSELSEEDEDDLW